MGRAETRRNTLLKPQTACGKTSADMKKPRRLRARSPDSPCRVMATFAGRFLPRNNSSRAVIERQGASGMSYGALQSIPDCPPENRM